MQKKVTPPAGYFRSRESTQSTLGLRARTREIPVTIVVCHLRTNESL